MDYKETDNNQSEITNYGSWKEWGIYLVQQVKTIGKKQDAFDEKVEELGKKLDDKNDSLIKSLKELDMKFDAKFDDLNVKFITEITKLKEKTNRQAAFYGIIGGAIGMITIFLIKMLAG